MTQQYQQNQINDTPVAQSRVESILLLINEDDPAAILDTTSGIHLRSSTAGSKAITTTSSYAGQKINIFLLASTGGDYTLALGAGTLTFNAAGESAVVQRDDSDTDWFVVGLSGATIV